MICLLHRWNIDRAMDEGAEVSARTQSHVHKCGACRSHFETQRRLVNRLEQPGTALESPTFLRARVMNAIRAGDSTRTRNARRSLSWLPIAACAVLILFFALKLDSPTPLPIQPATVLIPNAVPSPAFHLPSVNVTAAIREAHNQIISPYDQELKNLQSDLVAAGDYLSKLAVWNLTKGN